MDGNHKREIILTYTPLPSHLIDSPHSIFKAAVLYFFLLVVLTVIGIGGWYLYYFYTAPIIQLDTSRETSRSTSTPQPPTATPEATLQSEFDVPSDWIRKSSDTCAMTLAIPPPEEPYMIPRDPNTPPSSLDDEGKYWIFEEQGASLLMLDHQARALFKNPELPASGYVSSAVEVFCAPNTGGYTTESFMVKIQNDLLENYSVIKLKTVGETQMWGRDVRTASFEGGTFDGRDTYYIFTTQSHLYMVRSYGQSTNYDVRAVRDMILLGLAFD